MDVLLHLTENKGLGLVIIRADTDEVKTHMFEEGLCIIVDNCKVTL